MREAVCVSVLNVICRKKQILQYVTVNREGKYILGCRALFCLRMLDSISVYV